MAKAKVYGMRATAPKMSKHLERCFWKPAREQLQQQRNRERAPRTVVAAQITKEKQSAGEG